MSRTDNYICPLHCCLAPHFRIIAICTDNDTKFCTFRSVAYRTAASRYRTLERNPRIHLIITVNNLTFVIDHNSRIGKIVLFIHAKQKIKHTVHFQFRTFFLKLFNLRAVHSKQSFFPSKLRKSLNARLRCHKQIKSRETAGCPIHKGKQYISISIYFFHTHSANRCILCTNYGQAFRLNFPINSKYISPVHDCILLSPLSQILSPIK